jgi:hypothetical protein
MVKSVFDVLVVTDDRFSGGTLAAIETEVSTFSGLGARIGLLGVRSRYLSDAGDRPDPRFQALLDLDGVSPVPPGASLRAKGAFFHNPMVFFSGIEQGCDLDAEVAVLVAHHAPFRGDGSLEYDPLATVRAVQRRFGMRPRVAPVSGTVRHQLRSFAPFLRLTSEDWPNLFRLEDYAPRREIFSGQTVIGRHGRVDPLKWPDRAEEIARSLPGGPGRRVRVMGCPVAHLESLGVDTAGWEILDFNAEPVAGFLDSLDVFSYFYSPRLSETFGRTVAEAALMGAVCVLDRRLEPNFGPVGIYCAPTEVPTVLSRLEADPAAARRRAAEARSRIAAEYSGASLAARWQRLLGDRGVADRRGSVSASPWTVVRKMIGLRRRLAAARLAADAQAAR